jgi:alkylation response protein AidB-like acyl-CoA dehydrogenase
VLEPDHTVSGDLIQVAQNLKPDILAAADQIDADRALPDELVDRLKAAGFYRALIPARFGGLEYPLPDYLNAIQILAEGDASTAWCVNQGSVIGTGTVWLAPDVISEIWSDPEMAFANGPPGDGGVTLTDDGVVANGRWGFSSGCRHALWMTAAAQVIGTREWRTIFFPKQQATFHDTWDVQGLRGTASFEFTIEDLAVPARHVATMANKPTEDSRFYRIPTGLVFAVTFAGVALGVARMGINATLDLAQGKLPRFNNIVVKDDPDAQKMMGESEIRWRAAETFLKGTVERVWGALAHQDEIADEQRIHLRMAATHTIREAAAALDLAYTVAGSSGIYRSHPLHRRVQDMRVITQHVQARMMYYGYVGRYFLGHEFKPGPLN